MRNKLFSLLFAVMASISSLSASVKIGDLYYNLDAINSTAEVADNGYTNPISVNDQSLADWDLLDQTKIAEAVLPQNPLFSALKKIRVYADENYIHYVLFIDPAELPSHTPYDALHIYLNADNSDETGGFWDLFDAPDQGNTDLMFEGAIWNDEGEHISYAPYVSYWSGELNGEGWYWTPIMGVSSEISASQFIGDSIIEGQLVKKLIPWENWSDAFEIGFDIQQNWESAGLLPQNDSPDGERIGRSKKLHVDFPQSLPSGDIIIPASVEHEEVTYNVTSIGNKAFIRCADLTSIAIPNSVVNIGDEAFVGCNSLVSITDLATEPQTINANVFTDIDLSACTLYVPAESLETFKAADVWKDFGSILPIEDPIETEEEEFNIVYKGDDNKQIYSEIITLHLPVAPKIEGFTFIKWQIVAGDLKDEIVIQAVYEADEPSSAPSVVTNPSNPAQKLIRNGSVYILTDDSRTYTLTGQEVR